MSIKSLPVLVGTAVILGCVGLGANAAYATGNPGQEHAQNHTTVLWEYSGYPDLTKPQPYVDSVRGADIRAFDEYVKQPAMCGKTFQVDVYKTVVKGDRVESLWSKGYLEYGHDGGFLDYNLGYTPYKVLTGKDTECAPTSIPTPTTEPTTPPESPEPMPTDTPTLPPVTTPTPEPTVEPTSPVTPAPEPTSTPPTPEPTSPVTSTPTTPTEPEPTPTEPTGPAITPTPSSAPSTGTTVPPGGSQTPVPTTEPTNNPTDSATVPTGSATPSGSPSVPTKTDSGTTQKTQPTDDTARTLAYTGISVVGPLVAAGVLILLGILGTVIARKRKNL